MLKLRHSKGIGASAASATEFISKCDARLETAADVYRQLARMPITAASLKEYVDAVFPAPKRKAIVQVADTDIIEATGADILGGLLSRPLARVSQSMSEAGIMTDETSRRIHGEICDLFEGKGKGSDLAGSRGTAWGAYNAVTEYLTHHRGRSADSRANNVLLGDIGARAIQQAQAVFLGASN